MTITSVVDKVSAVGSGTARTFSFSPMVIYSNSELEVITTVITTGVETIRSRGTGATTYSISIAANGYPDTGTIDYPASGGTLVPSTERISIRRVLPLTQLTDLENQGGYNPETQETQYDKFTAQLLQLQEQIDRCVKFPVTNEDINSTFSPVIPVHLAANASQYLRLNAARTAIEFAALGATTSTASDATPTDSHVTSGAAGSSADYSRADHRHLVPTSIPRLATENVYTESQVWQKGSDVASADPLTLGAGNWFDVTGTTDINIITSIGVGTLIILHFDGILTLFSSTNDLVLPGAQDIVTFAGYEIMLYEYAAGDWRFVCDNADIALVRRQSVDFETKVTLDEDFLGDTLDGNKWNSTAGSGTGNAATMSAGAGGRFNLLTSSADAANSANGTGISSAALNWRADQGGLVMEARIQVDDITNIMFFVGLTDVESTTVEAPIFKTSGADTVDSDANNACGVCFDTDGTTNEFFQGGVEGGVDTAAQHSGSAPVNNTYVTIRAEVSSVGGVRGFINRTAISAVLPNAVSPTAPLTPIVVCINRSAAARNLLIDYIWVQANR